MMVSDQHIDTGIRINSELQYFSNSKQVVRTRSVEEEKRFSAMRWTSTWVTQVDNFKVLRRFW